MTRSTKPIALAAIAATLPALSACGSSKPDASKFLDNEKIERAIEASIKQQRHQDAAAQCPALEVKKKGTVFTCVAILRNGVRTTFKVTQTDDSGHVSYVGTKSTKTSKK